MDDRISELVSEYVGLINSGDGRFPLPEKFVRDKELEGEVLLCVLLETRRAFDLHLKQLGSQVRSIREYALALVEAETEQEAFARGKAGEGTPIHDAPPGGSLFDRFYHKHKDGTVEYPFPPSEWIRGLFAEHDGWQRADPTGLAERIWRLVEDRMMRHGTDWLRSNGLLGHVHETLTADQSYKYVLGDDPNFARVCAQAIGLMLIEPLAPRALGVLDLPPKDRRRRFLFFGMRSVT